MTSDNPSNNARDVVLLIGLVLLVLSGLATEVVSSEIKSSCADCGSHRSIRTLHWFAYGARGSRLTESSTQPSRFVQDFPELQCQQHWTDESEVEQKVWNSPLIGLSPRPGMTVWTIFCCCGGSRQPVWERYETDEVYRDSIQELLETGAATREKLIALAYEPEYRQEDALTPEEEAILKILYPDPYDCQAKEFKPLELPFLKELPQRNERPPI